MERNEVSIHEVRLFNVFQKNRSKWITSVDAAKQAEISPRTARAHCLKLVRMGILNQAEVFPAHRYQLADKAGKRNGGYVQRLVEAMEIFGIPSPS